MIVKLKQAWKTWPAGHVFAEMPQNQGSELVRRGIGEEIASAKPGIRAGRDYVTRSKKV